MRESLFGELPHVIEPWPRVPTPMQVAPLAARPPSWSKCGWMLRIHVPAHGYVKLGSLTNVFSYWFDQAHGPRDHTHLKMLPYPMLTDSNSTPSDRRLELH